MQVETDVSTLDLFLSKAKTLVSFKENYVKVTEDSTLVVNENVIVFGMQAKEDVSFETSLKIKIATFGIASFAEMDTLSFNYTNNSNESYTLSILLAKGANTMELDRYTIPANATVTISIPLIYNNQDGYNYERVIGKTDELRFVIVDNSTNKYDGSISQMTFTKEG